MAQAKAATEKPRDPEIKAGKNGTPIEEYAQRLLSAQAVDLAGTFKLARVERGLLAQEYPRAEIRAVIESMAEALHIA